MHYNEFLTHINEFRSTFSWHQREQDKSVIHAAVTKALVEYKLEPASSRQLALEWPHESDDKLRLAYTRTIEHGELNRQTVTSVGKFLTRHFPTAKSDVIRNIASLYTVAGCGFTDRSTDVYVDVVLRGPGSCMKWSDCEDSTNHPYQVYAPEHGWHMAIHTVNGEIWGRCICLDFQGKKLFVRSYFNDPSSQGYSNSDVGLEAWLKDQGYAKCSTWPSGAKLARFEDRYGNLLAPYLDGNTQTVLDLGSVLCIDPNGELSCCRTDGSLDDCTEECCECGENFDRDSLRSVGRNEDRLVCDRCVENHYFWVYGYRGQQYYLHEDDCTASIDDEQYDSRYLSDNDIVSIEFGQHADEYAHVDDTVIDVDGSRWHVSDVDHQVFLLVHGCESGEYVGIEKTWVCATSGFRYSCADVHVLHDGQKHHPSQLSEVAPEEEASNA
jgi:hypothetical protein